jgi:branched-chain amino acid transport system substrate-binding protein
MHDDLLRRARRGMRALAFGAAGLVSGALVGSCGDSAVTAPVDHEVVIGGLFPLTGSWSWLGQTSRAAMEIAIDDVNRELGGNAAGLRFAAAIEDTRFEAGPALEKTRALQTRGVQLLIGPEASAELVSISPFVQANGMLVVSPSSTAGSLAIAGDNILRFAPPDSLEAVAISAMMWDDGMRVIIPVWRDYPSTIGLEKATRGRFSSLGGVVLAGVEYDASTREFSATIAKLRSQVDQAIAQYGAGHVGVYLASFDELIQLFDGASADSVLGSIRWYGNNSGARVAGLLDNARATAFAIRTGFPNPFLGLDEGSRSVWEPVAARIRARTNIDPDAYGLAVYDAVWVAAKAYVAVGAQPGIEKLTQAYTTAAATHFGATGWVVLDQAGDRMHANYDFWAVRQVGGAPKWIRVALYDSQTGKLSRE